MNVWHWRYQCSFYFVFPSPVPESVVLKVFTLHKAPFHQANRTCKTVLLIYGDQIHSSCYVNCMELFFCFLVFCFLLFSNAYQWWKSMEPDAWTLRSGAPGLHVLFPSLPLTAPGKHMVNVTMRSCSELVLISVWTRWTQAALLSRHCFPLSRSKPRRPVLPLEEKGCAQSFVLQGEKGDWCFCGLSLTQSFPDFLQVASLLKSSSMVTIKFPALLQVYLLS